MTRVTTAVLATVAVLALSCKSNVSEEASRIQVETIQLKDTTCVVEYSFPATIKGIKDVQIFPQVSGRITAVNVKSGQKVKRGDVLFEIDNVPYKAAYESALASVEVAKAQLETSKLTLQSKKNLFDKGIISEYQYKLAQNEVKTSEAVLGQARASLANANNNLSFTKVRTMSDGYIGVLPYPIGSLIGPNIPSPLTTVSDNSFIYAEFSVTENDYLSMGLKPNLKDNKSELPPLNLRTNLGEMLETEGVLHSVSGMISSQTGTIQMKAKFENPGSKLLSGGSCTVVIKYAQDKLIVIPRAAMKEIQDKLFIFVVKDGKLVQTEVNATRLNSSQWALIPGEDGIIPVKAGDRITKTTNRLNDGAEVEIIK